MRIRIVLVVLMIALTAGFAALNWSAFVAPTQLSVLFATFEAPLGLLMLGLTMLLVLAFALYMAAWQGQILIESRRQAKAMEQQRVLADQAEASRFVELRGVVKTEFEQLAARLVQTQERLSSDLRDNTNSLAATLGEMDDRMRRGQSPQLPV